MSMTEIRNIEKGPAIALVNSLPVSDYSKNYQPIYDRGDLIDAVHELQHTRPTTTPDQVMDLRSKLTRAKLLGINVVLLGNCNEPVDIGIPISEVVERTSLSIDSVDTSELVDPLVISRGRGQSAKPRSNGFQEVNGRQIPAYMGDMINGESIDDRTPKGSNMVSTALQARDVELGLTDRYGHHVHSAHEALLLPYELSFLNDVDGSRFLLSTDLPWVGKKTNNPKGPQAELLSTIENPVGVKLGPGDGIHKIADIADKLNLNEEEGKLVFMLRYGLDHREEMEQALFAISVYARKALILYDLHGSTVVDEEGRKIRSIQRIKEEIALLASLAKKTGLHLNGVHLETMHDNSRLECVDKAGDIPIHPGNVDPQLNPNQIAQVLNTLHKAT